MHDYYLADGQGDKALAELQKAQEYLMMHWKDLNESSLKAG